MLQHCNIIVTNLLHKINFLPSLPNYLLIKCYINVTKVLQFIYIFYLTFIFLFVIIIPVIDANHYKNFCSPRPRQLASITPRGAIFEVHWGHFPAKGKCIMWNDTSDHEVILKIIPITHEAAVQDHAGLKKCIFRVREETYSISDKSPDKYRLGKEKWILAPYYYEWEACYVPHEKIYQFFPPEPAKKVCRLSVSLGGLPSMPLGLTDKFDNFIINHISKEILQFSLDYLRQEGYKDIERFEECLNLNSGKFSRNAKI